MQELTAAQKQQVLQPLAYALMQQGVRETERGEAEQIIAPHLALVSTQMHPDDFLQIVENTSGLLLERNPGVYGFAHLTFQEYLASVHVKDQGSEEVLVTHVGDSWWHETIRLYCAQSDATVLISACLAGDPPAVPILRLAFECQQEALKIQPSVREQLDMLLNRGVEDTDPERRRLVAEVLLARRLLEMIPLSETTYRDTSLVTCAEYQVFLDEELARGVFRQPDQWKKEIFPAGMGRTPVVGVRQSDAVAFCQWLNQRDPGTWHYRLLRVEEHDEKDERTQSEGVGCWTNEEGGFVWLKKPSLSYNQEQVLYNRDYVRLFVYVLMAFSAHNLTNKQACDLANIPIRFLVAVMNSNFARVLDNLRNLVSVLDQDANLTTIRAQLIELVSVLDQDFAGIPDYDLASVLDRNFSSVLDLMNTLDHDLMLARTPPSVFDQDFDLIHAIDLDRTRASIVAIASDLVKNPHLSNVSGLDIPSILDFASVLATALDRVSDRSHTFLTVKENEYTPITIEKVALLRLRIRLSALLLVLALRLWLQRKSSSRTRNVRFLDLKKSGPPEVNIIKEVYDNFLSLYRAFLILEIRTHGELSAWEGILLVKERHRDH